MCVHVHMCKWVGPCGNLFKVKFLCCQLLLQLELIRLFDLHFVAVRHSLMIRKREVLDITHKLCFVTTHMWLAIKCNLACKHDGLLLWQSCKLDPSQVSSLCCFHMSICLTVNAVCYILGKNFTSAESVNMNLSGVTSRVLYADSFLNGFHSWNFYVTWNLWVGFDPPPFCHISLVMYVFAVPVYMFKMLILSVFS
jgi:hypothetical protein